MAAHVLRLRLALLLGAFRGDARHVIRTVCGLAVLIAGTAAGCWALLTLRDADADVVLAATVLCGAAATLGFALAPVVATLDDPLDPRRFAVLSLPPVPLAVTLAVAGVLSIPVFVLLALTVVNGVVWTAQGSTIALTVLSMTLAVLTCVLLARVCMAATSLFLRERRSRELSGLFALVVLVIVVPVGVFLASLDWQGTVPSQLDEAVELLALTPLGAAWALPGRAALGEGIGVTLFIAIATVVVLAALWVLLVVRSLASVERPISTRERGGLGWFAVAPGTPGGAIAARSLLYWLRDRRYLANVIVIPFAAVLTTVPLLIVGVSPALVALIPVPFIALFLGWLPHNDLAYDSTAIWMHVASGVRGAADRIGRLIPVLLIGLPLLALAIPLAITVHGRWAILPVMIGVCAALFGAGLGLSSISSVAAPYAVSAPGESPFQQPQRNGASGAMSQTLVMFGSLALSAPTLWWAWLALGGSIEAAQLAFWWGIATGAVVLGLGVSIGAAVFRRGGSRIMEFAESA